jgi:gamma-glutamyltranspeptidase / glutathione hydrolase
MSQRCMVASSQPLAVEAAIHTLRSGGNAIDAAVTATLVLMVVEPMSTGIGGDCFALIYLAQKKQLLGINASGRAPRSLSIETMHQRGLTRMPLDGPMSVTVPGALDGLAQCLSRAGTITLREALQPAIFYAKKGFPVSEVAAQMWERSCSKLEGNRESKRVYLPGGKAPQPGQLFFNPDLARTLELIAEKGTGVLYAGEIGRAVVGAIQDLHGLMSLSDLTEHVSDWTEPIKTDYRGYDVVEMPPNNQGLAALIALNIVEGYPLSEMGHNSPQYLHYLIEAMKLALADARDTIADTSEGLALDYVLSKEYAKHQRTLISAQRAKPAVTRSVDSEPGDTVYVVAVDEQGNAVSMISSLFKAFGSGITVPETGLVLQNRASAFNLDPGHPNSLGPSKRPFHTIMPAMITCDNHPWVCFGVVGGSMQPQGHLQVVCNLVDFDMDPQSALDAPRFRVLDDGQLILEEGIPADVRSQLKALKHDLGFASSEEGFGGGQVVMISEDILHGGSDPRKDGCALGY